jgi:hypothetical protein
MNPTAIHEYTRAGLFLIPISPVNGKPVKGPTSQGWNLPKSPENPNGYSNDPEDIIKRTKVPGSNVGLALGPSKVVTIDIDDLEVARKALALADIDLDILLSDPQSVQFIGREGRGKLLYRVPEGFECCSTKLMFGEKGKGERAIFELRYKGSNGHTLQDVLPPSIHPDTNRPYKLVGDITQIPPLPQALTDPWTHWEEWKPLLQSLDPHQAEAINKAEKRKPKAPAAQVEGSIDPIATFNEQHSIYEVLTHSGYKKKGKRRYIRPGSTSNVPGIVLLDDSHIFSHGGDVLADGHKHDAFDVYRLLSCNGDWKRALEWNPDITQHNQRLWREQKGREQKSRSTSPQVENPAAFAVDDRGVWYCWPVEPGEAPKRQWICSPLHVRAFTRDEHNEGWGRLLEFTDAENRQHVWAMPMRLLSGDGREYRALLLDMGLTIAPGRPARDCLMIYIQTAKPNNWARCVERTGWHNNAFVLPDEVIGGENGEQVLLQTASNAIRVYRAAGTLEAWQREVSALCVGNTRLVFSVSCAFAAPLLQLAGEENGGFHFRGPSSIGKTTALFVACSVFGGRDYLQRWRATINGLEGVAIQHNDTLLCLDELKQVDPREAGEVAYLLASGSGKQRANQHGGARDRYTWRLLFLSSGETSLADHMRTAGKKAQAGQETRLADIPSETGKYGVFENLHRHESGDAFARALTQAAHTYHGTAGREFLRQLVALDPNEVAKQVGTLRDDFMKEHVPRAAWGGVGNKEVEAALS